MHGHIEKKLRKHEHFVPADFVRDIEEARKHPRPYYVETVNYKEFYDFSNGYYSIRPGSKKGDPFVTDLRCLKCEPDGHIWFKLNFSEDWTELPRRPKPATDVYQQLKPFYRQPLPLQERKFKDLQELKTCMEEDCHLFYDNLRHSNCSETVCPHIINN
ncbi:hypothetical protein JTB14_018291 [Gonioctena quinquepunctata]|nr:hypothetical protein JTB14_018291 [Gonioctena quinquepunctata]